MPRRDHFEDLTYTGTISPGAQSKVEGNWIPDTDDNRTLGDATHRWSRMFLATALDIDPSNFAGIRIVDGTTFAATGAGIQAAIDDLPATGGIVFIPAGTYQCSAAITITDPSVKLIGAGFSATILNFTAATHGIHVSGSNMNGVEIADLQITTGASALSGIRLEGSPSSVSYGIIRRVFIQPGGGSSFATGIEFINAQNWLIEHGLIFANAGNGITDCITLDTNSRGNTFVGASITGKATSGTATGVTTTGSASFAWFGGVVQGGFTTAAFNIASANASGVIYRPHIEHTSGGGDGLIYDNSTGPFSVLGGHISSTGNALNIGPTANAWGFSIYGGIVEDISVGAFARNPILWPSEVNNTVTVNASATHVSRGPLRRTGQSVPDPYQIASGINNDGSGFKHARVSTGSIAASSSAAVTVTWTTAFANANYTVTASVVQADADALTLRINHIESVTASAVVIWVTNDDAVAAKTGTLQVIAVHD